MNTLGRIIAVVDQFVYCVFPILGYRLAIAIPKKMFSNIDDEKIKPDFRFFVDMNIPAEIEQLQIRHEDFNFTTFTESEK